MITLKIAKKINLLKSNYSTLSLISTINLFIYYFDSIRAKFAIIKFI